MDMGKLLPSKKALIFLVIVLFMVCVVFGFAIYRDAEICFSKDESLRIIPKGSQIIKELENKLANSVKVEEYKTVSEELKKVQSENRILRGKLGEIKSIMCANGEDESDVLPKLHLLYTRVRDLDRDIKYSFSFIRSEMRSNEIINTKLAARDQTQLAIYRHVEKVLSAIGAHNGKCDGDQAETCNAVMQFQAANGLVVDGVIGEKTWSAMSQKFEEEKRN